MGVSIAIYPTSVRWDGEKNIPFLNELAKQFEAYENEGYLRDALEVAKFATKFDYDYEKVEEIEGKIKLLESEDSYDKPADL